MNILITGAKGFVGKNLDSPLWKRSVMKGQNAASFGDRSDLSV